VTSDQLARSYLSKAEVRLAMLEFLMEREAWSDVIREAQELVELALKAMLRMIGVDPPKWHDVGPVLTEQCGLLPDGIRADVDRLAAISRWLRKERELAFYGDIDFVPTRAYTRLEAAKALEDARFVVERTTALLAQQGGDAG
jgi:HEPN domain-containing protein